MATPSSQAQLQTCQKLDAGGPPTTTTETVTTITAQTTTTTRSCKVNKNKELLIASRIPNSDSATITAAA